MKVFHGERIMAFITHGRSLSVLRIWFMASLGQSRPLDMIRWSRTSSPNSDTPRILGSIKWWLRNVANLIAARYVVVDAVNNEKVLQFYARNQFWTVFKSEEDERKANELEDGQPLLTRFMISDLK